MKRIVPELDHDVKPAVSHEEDRINELERKLNKVKKTERKRKDNKTVILDGAHNLCGVTALINSIIDMKIDKKIIAVTGMLRDKQYEKCVKKICTIAKTFISTTPNNQRSVGSTELFNIAEKCDVQAFDCPEIEEAVKKSLEIAEDDDIILICGSLYLLGDAKKSLNI